MADGLQNVVSVFEETVSYETLWAMYHEDLKSIAMMFEEHKELPSKVLQRQMRSSLFLADLRAKVERFISDLAGFSVCIHGAFQYPERLQEARYPLAMFYYRGDIGLAESPCISVVGARKCTDMGAKRAAKLAKGLVSKDYTVVSGLAAGIDTAAMKAAIGAGGRTIGVVGTPIDRYYPKENRELQEHVAQNCLLISQVPFYRYDHEPFRARRRYFPQRNATMAALSEATVIVEASDTSGTHTQARACLQQGRKLFILDSCFENSEVSWPAKYEKRGAIRVRSLDDILEALAS